MTRTRHTGVLWEISRGHHYCPRVLATDKIDATSPALIENTLAIGFESIILLHDIIKIRVKIVNFFPLESYVFDDEKGIAQCTSVSPKLCNRMGIVYLVTNHRCYEFLSTSRFADS